MATRSGESRVASRDSESGGAGERRVARVQRQPGRVPDDSACQWDLGMAFQRSNHSNILRYRKSSISNQYDIEECFISKPGTSISKQYYIEKTSIIRFRSSELRYRYMPISKIFRYRQMLLRYLYTISKLCASISNFVFFDIGVPSTDPAWAAVASTRYWTKIVVCRLHC